MNITMEIPQHTIDLRNNGIFAPGAVVGKPVGGVKVSAVKDTKTSKEDLGFSVKISRRSRAMYEQFMEEKRQRQLALDDLKEQASLAADKGLTIDYNNAAALEGTVVYSSDKWRMVTAAHHGVYDDVIKKEVLWYSFDSLAPSYAEIRKEYEAEYTGEALKERLNTLDAEYESAAEHITQSMENAIRFYVAVGDDEAARRAIRLMVKAFGMETEDFFKEIGIDEQQPLTDYLEEIIEALKSYAMRYAYQARQNILEGIADADI